MTLRAQIDRELAAAAMIGAGARIEVPCTTGRVIVELLSVDAIGCGLDFLCFESTLLSAATVADLQKVSERLIGRVNYLLEPMGVLEVDRESCVLQMRSMPPDRDEEGTRYYELWVRRGGEVALTRYQKRKGQLRERVAAHLTREVVSRLAADFVASVEG